MNALATYQFPATGHDIRIVVRDGDPWFVARDLTAALDIANGRDAVGRLDSDGVGTADVIDSMGRTQVASIVSEAGLYELIFQSRKPEAKAFRRWVTGDVLPTIRRTGGYESAPALPRTYADALRELAATVEQAEQAQAQLAITAPKAEAFDAYQSADGTHSFAEVAKMLHADTGLGRNLLIRRLRELKVLMPSNEPYQRYAEHFHVVAQWFEHGDGSREVTNTTRVRASGVEFIRRKLAASP